VSQDESERAGAILAKARHKTYSRDDWFAQIRYAIITTNPDQNLPPLSGRLGADTEEKGARGHLWCYCQRTKRQRRLGRSDNRRPNSSYLLR
jgi:hypothetical protein